VLLLFLFQTSQFILEICFFYAHKLHSAVFLRLKDSSYIKCNTSMSEQIRQCAYNVTLRRVSVTNVAV